MPLTFFSIFCLNSLAFSSLAKVITASLFIEYEKSTVPLAFDPPQNAKSVTARKTAAKNFIVRFFVI